CGTPPPDPKKEEDTRWRDKCRKLSARFLQDLLTRALWREAVPFAGVQIKGAQITGDVDLANAKLIRLIEIVNSRIEGAINLRRARTDSLIVLDGSRISGHFDGDSLHSESDLFFRNGATFKSEVSLSGAKIDGNVAMAGASFDGTLNVESLQVGSMLLMRSASFKNVVPRGAKITGQVSMTGASFKGELDASSLQASDLYMRSEFMRSDAENKASFRDVDLRGARITGQISMRGASFYGALTAYLLQVGSDLFMSDANCADEIDMTYVHVGGNMDLRGVKLGRVDIHLNANTGTGKMDHGGKALVGFFIACGDAAELFKIPEEVFCEMTPFGHFKVARNRARPIAFRRDDGAGAPLIQLGARPIIVEGASALPKGSPGSASNAMASIKGATPDAGVPPTGQKNVLRQARDEARWPDFESPFCAGAMLADPDDRAVDDRVFEVLVQG
ncbi:MAG: pentapeptide repeat-containing protein, partial [Methylocella sp.]